MCIRDSLWAIRRSMATVEGFVTSPPVVTLVARAPDGAPYTVDHGRTLYLVRPVASNAAVQAWVADGRAHGRESAPALAPKPRVPKAKAPAPAAPVVPAVILSADESARALRRLEKLRSYAGANATLVGVPAIEQEFAMMMEHLKLSGREVAVMGELLAEPAKWGAKTGHPTIETLATYREPGALYYNWRGLLKLASAARAQIKKEDIAAAREEQARAARAKQARAEAVNAAAHTRERDALQAQFPDLQWTPENYLSNQRKPHVRAYIEAEQAKERARLRAKYPDLQWGAFDGGASLTAARVREANKADAGRVDAATINLSLIHI